MVIEAVLAELAKDATVTALVGTSVFPQAAPEGEQPPHVVLSVVSDVPENSFTGTEADRTRSIRLQVDCYAKGYIKVHQVADAVAAVLGALARPDLSAVREISRDLYDDPTQLHRVSSDFSVTM
jgi:hypothetical protein